MMFAPGILFMRPDSVTLMNFDADPSLLAVVHLNEWYVEAGHANFVPNDHDLRSQWALWRVDRCLGP